MSSPVLEISERDQAGELVATYLASSTTAAKRDGRVDVATSKEHRSLARNVLDAFLPAGYPHSVTSDYLEYQIYDSLQAFSSAIAGLLSSRAVLEGVGVGDATASPTAALLLSVLQDSTGRIATILFAHKLGTSLEPECKMYRLAADFFNDAAMILDCLSPAFPRVYRVLILSCSSVLRALCGVAAGSSKASLSAHFATQGNLGELNAKDSSQETIISLMGMLAGSFVVARVSSPFATWACMIALLSIHLGMNYLAVRAVNMRTLNRQRANLVLSHFLSKPVKGRALLTPEQVSTQEKVFERDGVLRWQGKQILGRCRVGVPLQRVLDSINKSNPVSGAHIGSSPDLQRLLKLFQSVHYILWCDAASATFLIVLKSPANTTTQLLAWLHALVAARRLQDLKTTKQSVEDLDAIFQLLERTMEEVTECKDELLSSLSDTEWDLETGALETVSGTRIQVRED